MLRLIIPLILACPGKLVIAKTLRWVCLLTMQAWKTNSLAGLIHYEKEVVILVGIIKGT